LGQQVSQSDLIGEETQHELYSRFCVPMGHLSSHFVGAICFDAIFVDIADSGQNAQDTV
jgi:hypothetical protein